MSGNFATTRLSSKGQFCDYPDDDKFFALPIASRAKVIIRCYKHLLQKSGYSGIIVLKPTEFLYGKAE